MKLFALAAIAVFATMAQAGATIDMLAVAAPEQCRDQCRALAEEVGMCMETLDAEFSASVRTSDPNSLTWQGDVLGARDCACSEASLAAMPDCLSCLSDQMQCLGDDPLTVADAASMCQDGFGTLAALQKRYGSKICAAPAQPPLLGVGSGGKKCCSRHHH